MRLFILILIVLLTTAPSAKQQMSTDKLRPLYKAKQKPKPGDWLWKNKEMHYTLGTYMNSSPVRPDKARRFIYVYSLGENSPAEDSLIAITCQYLECVFHLKTIRAGTLPLSCVPKGMRRMKDGNFQVCTKFVLDTLVRKPLPLDAAVSICFTNHDLYPQPTWNYVFGEASLTQRVGVWSFKRYGNPDKKTEFKTVLMRTLKVASHETGHMFSITHCIRYECNMNGSNSLEESDSQPLHFCPDCLEKLAWNIGFDMKAHFKELSVFYGSHGFAAESLFINKNLGLMK